MAVQTTSTGMQYIGNPDFRGYVYAVAPQYLGVVGNDGGINQGALQNSILASGALQDQVPDLYQKATSDIGSLYNQFQQYQNGGGGGGTTSTGASTGPSIADLTNSVNATQSGYESGARTGLMDTTNTYQKNIQDFLNNTTDQQSAIDQGKVSNALNLRRTMAQIVQGVRNGLRSGGVMLANANATDSGASDALARAWATVGNTQTQSAQGQAGQQNEALDTQQGQLKRYEDQTLGNLDTFKSTEVNRARADLLNKLQLLDTTAQGEGVPGGTVDMGIVDRVISDAVARLSSIDQQRSNVPTAMSAQDILAKALNLDQLGAAASPFSVSSPTVTGPAGNAGATLGNLPIFVKSKDRTPLGLVT